MSIIHYSGLRSCPSAALLPNLPLWAHVDTDCGLPHRLEGIRNRGDRPAGLARGFGIVDPAKGAMSSPTWSGGLFVLAGVFQFTGLKAACLTNCRTPLMFINTRWRDGRFGPYLMGLDDGVYCLGCCWALMMLMFVVGVMNVLWMAALTAIMILERLYPSLRLERIFGVLMIAVGTGMAIL